MTTDYNPTEAQRLISEAREDDARMTSAPWMGPTPSQIAPNWVAASAAFARTRNNLRDLADQLEAAGREVERRRRPPPAGCQCTYEHGDSDCSVHPTCPGCGESLCGTEVVAERDSLRQQLEAIQRDAAHPCIRNPCAACLAFETATGIRSDRTHAGEIEAIAAAQRRIAELERHLAAARSSLHNIYVIAAPKPTLSTLLELERLERVERCGLSADGEQMWRVK